MIPKGAVRDLLHSVAPRIVRLCAKFQDAETLGKNVMGLRTQGGSVEKSLLLTFRISGVETVRRREIIQGAKMCAHVPRVKR